MTAQRPSLAGAARPRKLVAKASTSRAPAREPSNNCEQAAMLPAKAPRGALKATFGVQDINPVQ